MQETQPADQGSVQSVQDIIAAKFGVMPDQPEEAAPQEETEEQAPESDEIEVEWGEGRYRVPKALEEPISKARDYTQKTQQLADQRRQVEFQQKALEAARIEREFTESVQGDLSQLQLMDNYLAQMQQVDVNQLDMESGFKHWMQLQQLQKNRDNLHSSIESRRGEYANKAKAAVERLKSEARDLLSKSIPGFSDQTLTEIAAQAKTLGYSDEEIELLKLDPRAAQVLYKAVRWDQVQANKTAMPSVSPVVKPTSSNPMPQEVKNKLAFGKAMKSAKTSQEKARLIETRLAGMF